MLCYADFQTCLDHEPVVRNHCFVLASVVRAHVHTSFHRLSHQHAGMSLIYQAVSTEAFLTMLSQLRSG